MSDEQKDEQEQTMSVARARKIMKDALNSDEDVKIAYVSNVAMLLYDELGDSMASKAVREALANKILNLLFN